MIALIGAASEKIAKWVRTTFEDNWVINVLVKAREAGAVLVDIMLKKCLCMIPLSNGFERAWTEWT